MKRLTATVEVELGQRGSNHGLVTTSDGLVRIDGPHKPSDTLRLKAEIERRGLPLRYILNTEPHGDHWTSNAYFDVPVVAHEGVRARILASGPSGPKSRSCSRATGRTRRSSRSTASSRCMSATTHSA